MEIVLRLTAFMAHHCNGFSFDVTVPLKILLLHVLFMFLLQILLVIWGGKYLHYKAFKIFMVLYEEKNLILELNFNKIKG